jgi:hypothetical protein
MLFVSIDVLGHAGLFFDFVRTHAAIGRRIKCLIRYLTIRHLRHDSWVEEYGDAIPEMMAAGPEIARRLDSRRSRDLQPTGGTYRAVLDA